MARRNASLQLDAEEQAILDAFERGELVSAPDAPRLKARLQLAATNTLARLAKDRRVNIRLPARTLSVLQMRAAEEGLPYQTLIASVLHKYATGRLLEKPRRAAPVRTKRARDR